MSDTFRKVCKELGEVRKSDIEAMKDYAEKIEAIITQYPCRETSLAMTNLEQSVMWGTKAISRV